MNDRLAQALRLDPGETRRALFLAGILFALTGSYTLVKTARDALFLAQLPAATLPYVYLGVGVLTTRRRRAVRALDAARLGVAFAGVGRLGGGGVAGRSSPGCSGSKRRGCRSASTSGSTSTA